MAEATIRFAIWRAGRRCALGLKASLHSTTLHCVSSSFAKVRWVGSPSGWSRRSMLRGISCFTKHVDVTLTIFELIEVELFEYMEAGIMFDLDIETDNDAITK
jgi:hypothetical protein